MSGLTSALLLSVSALGALPYWVVQDEKYRACLDLADAPEEVQIRVVKVRAKVTWCGNRGRARFRTWRYKDLEVRARVLKVGRSASGLKPGQVIRFSYHLFHLCPRMVGPANRPQPMALSNGDVVWAYLSRDKGRTFSLAAGAMSFQTTRPNIQSKKAWQVHCDQLYNHRHRPGTMRRPVRRRVRHR